MSEGAGRTFVVVGASLAGGKAVETLRAEGFDGRVVLVGEEEELPYERPPLSKGVLLGNEERDVAYLHDLQWYVRNSVELRLGTRATTLDVAAHQVAVTDGEPVHYDRLLIATGSSVRRLRVPGEDLTGVHYLRTMTDCLHLLEAFTRGARVVVVGAGWIGLETAAAARSHGADVVVVEPQSTALLGPLGAEMGEFFADLHRDHGVDFRFGHGVTEIRGDATAVRSVLVDDGTELPADVVVVGVGIRPNTDLAETGGLEVDNGIVTDSARRTSDADVFAAGDVASWHSTLLGHRVRVEHWANAHDGGEAVARSMLGRDVTYDVVPFFYSDQYDLGMEYAGFVGPDGYDSVVVRGDQKARELVAFWTKDGRVLAGMNVNVWDVQDDIQALIRSGRRVDATRLADPSVPLTDL